MRQVCMKLGMLLCIVAAGQADKVVDTGLLKSKNGMCLNQHPVQAESGLVHMWRCDNRNENSYWSLNRHGQFNQIRSAHNGCLHDSSSRARTVNCGVKSAHQSWRFDASTGQVRNSRGICLATAESHREKVQMQSCDETNPDQQWEFVRVVTHQSLEEHTLGEAVGRTTIGEAEDNIRHSSECEVTAWSQFTECTKSCGSGVQKRTRAIKKVPAEGRFTCGVLVETRACSRQPCSSLRSCVVGAWGTFDICTHKCGGGVQVRTRDVVVQAEPGGVFCPTLLQERHCNTFGCVSGGEQDQKDAIMTLRTHASHAKDKMDSVLNAENSGNTADPVDMLNSVKAYARALAGKDVDHADGDSPQVTEIESELEARKRIGSSEELSFDGTDALDNAKVYVKKSASTQQDK